MFTNWGCWFHGCCVPRPGISPHVVIRLRQVALGEGVGDTQSRIPDLLLALRHTRSTVAGVRKRWLLPLVSAGLQFNSILQFILAQGKNLPCARLRKQQTSQLLFAKLRARHAKKLFFVFFIKKTGNLEHGRTLGPFKRFLAERS